MNEFLDINDVRLFVKDWNLKYPVDRWWREKYNIPFGSPQHLDQSLLDMRICFEDDHFHVRIDVEEFNKKQRSEGNGKYQPGRGMWLKKQPKFTKMTSESIDSAFDRLLNSDLSKLNLGESKSGKMRIKA